MTVMKTLVQTLLLLVAVTGLPAGAAPLPDFYPPSFNHSGPLDGVDPRGGTVVIGDVKFFLTSDLRVHTPDRHFATLQTLRPGTRVGINYVKDGKGTPFVADVWVLPAGALALPPPR